MGVISFFVVVVTSISGGLQEVTVSNKLEYIYEHSIEIINEYAQNFDADEALLISNEEQEDLLKISLLNFNQELGLIDSDLAIALANDIDSYVVIDPVIDEDLTYTTNNLSLINLDETRDFSVRDINTDDTITKVTPIEIGDDQSLGYLIFDDSRAGDSSYVSTSDDEDDLLPIYEISADIEPSVNINHVFGDYTFLGVEFNADTCISFYNTLSSFINNVASYYGDALAIIQILKAMFPTQAIELSVLANSVKSHLVSFWDEFVLTVTNGIWGAIFGLIIGVLVLSVLYIMTRVYISGYQKKGYRIGRKIYEWYDWEWVNEQF